jgi:hypothetical protein
VLWNGFCYSVRQKAILYVFVDNAKYYIGLRRIKPCIFILRLQNRTVDKFNNDVKSETPVYYSINCTFHMALDTYLLQKVQKKQLCSVLTNTYKIA